MKNPDINELIKNLPHLNEYKTYPAVVLKKEIKIELNKNGTIKKRVYTVLKIMNQKGETKHSTLKLLYNKDFEKIDVFQAGTYNKTNIFTPPKSIKDKKPEYIKRYELYNNLYFKVINFDNVIKGNIIEIGYDIFIKKNDKNLDGILILNDYEPILDEDITISIPENKDLFFKLVKGKNIFSESYLKDGYKIYHFSGKDLNPLKDEINSPPIGYFASKIIFSTYKSWDEALKKFRYKFFNDAEVKLTLPKEITNLKTKYDYLKNTYYYLNSIKNVFVPLNESFLKINSPEMIMEKKYGNILDKTFLMYEILKKKNIEVYPILFENHKINIDKNIPTLKQFNYMGLKVILNEKTYYFQPMMENSAFPYSSFINKNVCMVVKHSKYNFETMKLSNSQNGFESNYNILLNKNKSIDFSNITTTWGGFSIVARDKLKNSTESELKNSIQSSYPNVKNVSVSMTNLKNPIDPFKIKLNMKLTDYLLKERNIYFFQLPPNIYDFTSIVIDTSLEKRENPLYIGEPFKATTNYSVSIPKNMIPLFLPDKLKFENKYLNIYIIPEYLKEKNILRIRKEVETKARYLPKSIYKKVKSAINNFNNVEYNLLIFKGKNEN